MASIPTTTQLGPDQARLRATMRRLAELTSTEAPILSLYVDVRAHAHGEGPGERPQLISIQRRLDAIAADLQPHTPSRESVDGQVDEPVIDETAAIDHELRTELVRQAALIDASVELVREHERLLRHEGVGATLRFRIDGDGAEQDR